MEKRGRKDFLNSIEVLDLSNLQAGWRLIDTKMRPRRELGVATLSDSKILIFGGTV